MKKINSDEIFSVLMKIMKKVESGIDLVSMNSNLRVELKISSISGLQGEIVECIAP